MDGQFRLKRVSFLWTGSVWVSINCSFFPFGPNILYTVYYPVYTSNNIFLILHCMYLNRFKVVYLQSVTTGIYSKMSTAILYVLTIQIIIRRFILGDHIQETDFHYFLFQSGIILFLLANCLFLKIRSRFIETLNSVLTQIVNRGQISDQFRSMYSQTQQWVYNQCYRLKIEKN